MTIAVGAKYPWGDLSKLPPPGVNIPEAVILASDSRFSQRIPGGYAPISDVGTKVFPLGSDVAAAYAGVSEIGELCLDELRLRLSKETNQNSIRSRGIAQKAFDAVYRHRIALMKLRPEDAPLYFLLGACGRNGQAELYRFSYEDRFVAEPITGVGALAWPETAKAFNLALHDALRQTVEDELSLRTRYPQVPIASLTPMPIHPQQVAMLITGILGSIIEAGADATIGGLIQCAVITSEGIAFPNISYSHDPTNEGPGWTPATARKGELVRVTRVSGTLGFHSLSG